MKKYLLFFSVLLAAAAVLYVIVILPVATQKLNVFAVEYLEKITKHKVYVEDISINLINRVTLKGITIQSAGAPEALFSSKKISVEYNLLYLIFGKRKVISSIYVLEPKFWFSAPAGGAAGFPVIETIIEFKGGEINFKTGDERLDRIRLVNISGRIRPPGRLGLLGRSYEEGDMMLELSGGSIFSERDTFKINAVAGLPAGGVKGNVSLSFEEIGAYRALLPDDVSISGSVSLNAVFSSKASGSIKELISQGAFSGDAVLKGCSVRVPSLPVPMDGLSGPVHFDRKGFSTSRLEVSLPGGDFIVEGEIEPPSYMDMRLKGKLIPSGFSSLFGKRVLEEIKGAVDVQAEVKGDIDDLSGNLTASWEEIDICGLPLGKGGCKASFREKVFNIDLFESGFMDGKLEVKGKYRIDQDYIESELNITGIPLLSFGIGWLSGTASFMGRLFGTSADPYVKGNFFLEDIRFGSQGFTSLEGGLEYGNDEITLNVWSQDRNYELKTSAVIGDKSIDIKSFDILLWNRGHVNVLGSILLAEPMNLDMSVNMDNIELKEIRVLKNYLREIEGLFDFSGRISGTLASPDITGKLKTTGCEAAGIPMELSALIAYKDLELGVKELEINRAYNGALSFFFSKPVSIEGAVNMDSGDIKIFSALLPFLRVLKESSGMITGQISFKGALKEPFFDIKIDIQNPEIRDTGFDRAYFEGSFGHGLLNIMRCRIEKGSGSFEAIGGNLEKDRSRFVIKGSFLDYPLSSGPLSGDLILNGVFDRSPEGRISARLLADKLVFRGRTFKSLGMEGYWTSSGWKIASFKLDDFLDGRVRSDSGKLDGDIKINITDMASYLKWIGLESKLRGGLTGKASIGGTETDPHIMIDLAPSGLKWKDVMYKGGLSLRFKGGVLDIVSMKILSQQGSIDGNGSVALRSSGPVNISGKITGFDYSFIKKILSEKWALKGPVEGEWGVEGNIADWRMKVSLIGSHGIWDKIDLKDIKTDFIITKDNIEVSDVFFKMGESSLFILPNSRVSWSVSSEDYGFTVSCRIKNLPLANTVIFGGFSVKGSYDPLKKDIKGELLTEGLWINQHNFDNTRIFFSQKEDILEFLPPPKGESGLRGSVERKGGVYDLKDLAFFLKGRKVMSIQGWIDPSSSRSLDLEIVTSGDGMEIKDLIEILDLKNDITGQAKFQTKLSGDFSMPRITVTAQVEDGFVGKLSYDLITLFAQVKDNVLDLKQFKISKKNKYVLLGQGTVPVSSHAASDKIDLRFEMKEGNLNILNLLGFSHTEGPLDLELSIAGTRSRPMLNGHVLSSNGQISVGKVIKELKDFRADLVIENNRVTIRELSGRAKKGFLNIKGYLILSGWGIEKSDIIIESFGKGGIPVTMPVLLIPQKTIFEKIMPGIPSWGEVQGSSRIHGDREGFIMEGKFLLENTHFSYPVRDTNDVPGWTPFDLFVPLTFNQRLEAGNNVWYENEYTNAQIRGGILITGPYEEPVLNGHVETIRGEINYISANFEIQEASLDLIDSIVYLEGRAQSEIGDDQITMTVSKKQLEYIEPRFSSAKDPEMNSDKALRVATGLNTEELTWEERKALARKEMFRLIDSTLTSPILRGMIQRTGLDVVKVEAGLAAQVGKRELDAQQDSSIFTGTRVLFGKQLGSKLYLGYGLKFDETYLPGGSQLDLRHEMEMLYRLKGSRYLKGRLSEEDKFIGLEEQIRF